MLPIIWVIVLGVVIFGSTAFAQQSSPAGATECPLVIEPSLTERFQAARRNRSIEARPIYGCDDRKNLYDTHVTDHQRKAAQATAILVHNNQLRKSSDGTRFDLPGRGAGLCSPEEVAAAGRNIPERFWDEPAPGFCSGFKVGTRLVATAGHCIANDRECRGDGSKDAPGTSFVFKFAMTGPDARPHEGIRRENVYSCVRWVGGSEGESDWAVVEVDRDIDAPQVTIRGANTTPPLAVDTPITVIGYPIGLPVKVADNATVREMEDNSFIGNLDTYGGNSGSAVFNTNKLAKGEPLVEGILVSGAKDFLILNERCYVSRQCNNKGCSGERVTRISEIVKALKK